MVCEGRGGPWEINDTDCSILRASGSELPALIQLLSLHHQTHDNGMMKRHPHSLFSVSMVHRKTRLDVQKVIGIQKSCTKRTQESGHTTEVNKIKTPFVKEAE